MSKQLVEALEASLREGTFTEASSDAVAAHLSGRLPISFSRLRRFILGDSLTDEQAEHLLRPLVVHSEQAHRYVDLCLIRLGMERSFKILQQRELPTRFRGVIEFLRKSETGTSGWGAGWVAKRLLGILTLEGRSLESFELLELLSLNRQLTTPQADSVTEGLLETGVPQNLVERLVLQKDGVSAILGSLGVMVSESRAQFLWSELANLLSEPSRIPDSRSQMLILLVLSLARSPQQNAAMDEAVAFLLNDFPQLPATEAFRRDYYLRGLEKLTCRDIAEQFDQFYAPGLESLLLKAMLRDAPPEVLGVVSRHRGRLARPFAQAVATDKLREAISCLTLAEFAGIHQPMLFYFAWEVYGFEEAGHREVGRRFQFVESRDLHVRREGEELNPVAFLRSVRALSRDSDQEQNLLDYLARLKNLPYYDPQMALNDLGSLLERVGNLEEKFLGAYFAAAEKRNSYEEEIELGDIDWN